MLNLNELRRKLDKAEEYLRSPDYYMVLTYLQNAKDELNDLINEASKHYDPITGQNKE